MKLGRFKFRVRQLAADLAAQVRSMVLGFVWWM